MAFLNVTKVGDGSELPSYYDKSEMREVIAHLQLLENAGVLQTLDGFQEALGTSTVKHFGILSYHQMSDWFLAYDTFVRLAWSTRVEYMPENSPVVRHIRTALGEYFGT